jgi:Zn-finger nucleic acid-binding protein
MPGACTICLVACGFGSGEQMNGGKTMNCPVDGSTLQMADRSGIEIDYCPTCRGVWLDRGELDKIIERTSAPAAAAGARGAPPPAGVRRDRDDDWDDDDYPRSSERYEGDYRPHKRKRKSLLGELFDF